MIFDLHLGANVIGASSMTAPVPFFLTMSGFISAAINLGAIANIDSTEATFAYASTSSSALPESRV